MYKRIELDTHVPSTGEPRVQLAAFPNTRGGLSIEKRAFAESESPIYDVLKIVQPEPGVTYLLVNALSAWEYYDDNKNGDGFNERPYRVGERATCGHPDCTKTLDGWIAEHELITKHYQSFEVHGGIYVHHKNQDKTKSRGGVAKSIWNPRMHRNELLLKYYNDRGVEIVDRVNAGDFPSVSMGCLKAGTRITLGNGETRPIEEIKIGDQVLTHLGRSREVTELHPRTFTGRIYTLTLDEGHSFEATEEHPFLVVTKEQVQRKNAEGVVEDPLWKLSTELDKDVHYLLQPRVEGSTKDPTRVYDNYLLVPIRELTSRDYSGPVYNFEVAEDNTYVSNGVVSHNCHVKWDVCTICGHRAPTRAHYCEHAKNYLRKVLPDGRKVSVLNPSAKLFDISMVIKPADPTGRTLMKVAFEDPYGVSSASLGEAWLAERAASDRFLKAAAEMQDAWGSPLGFMANFAELSLAAGAPSLPSQSTAFRAAAEKYALDLSDAVLDRLVLATPALTALLGERPMALGKVASEIHHVMRSELHAPFNDIPSMSWGPGAAYRATEPPRTDVLTVTDPYTGHVYQTTRGTAMDASRADVSDRLLRTGLFGALYAGGLHAGLGGALGAWSLPLGLAAGAATDKFLRNTARPYRNPLYQTDQGVPVSGGTEFKQASAWAAKLAEDVHERGGLKNILRRTSPYFQKWASLHLDHQVDYLLHGTGEGDILPTLARNLHTLLVS